MQFKGPLATKARQQQLKKTWVTHIEADGQFRIAVALEYTSWSPGLGALVLGEGPGSMPKRKGDEASRADSGAAYVSSD